MKKNVRFGKRDIQYYSINLCSHDTSGDYELFPSEKIEINIEEVVKRFANKANVKWSGLAAQFIYKEIKISLYREGRVILEGVRPDSHEDAFRFLEEILCFSQASGI